MFHYFYDFIFFGSVGADGIPSAPGGGGGDGSGRRGLSRAFGPLAFLFESRIFEWLSEESSFCVVFAAVQRDVAHPGNSSRSKENLNYDNNQH